MDRLETKAAFSIGEAGEITATAWPFGTADSYGDIITKGAFAGASLPLPMLFAHRPDDPVGVWEAVEETDAGLIAKGRLLLGKVARADEMAALIGAGALSGVSIGFNGTKATFRKSAGRTIGRTISSLNLMEISLVTFPAHPGARITGAKNAARAIALAEAINRAAARFTI
ncbi:HK97 family phage prohead protease [Aureimonas psammosilenae]|uniref:HK97 family phage prohead protease n=1 Tax=Aureimonas psammosilenae TaxID=2495496 RepID=UPI001260461D|nr:HK97 family phage prohead protease [Aureimonas psammosilenae]